MLEWTRYGTMMIIGSTKVRILGQWEGRAGGHFHQAGAPYTGVLLAYNTKYAQWMRQNGAGITTSVSG